MKGTICKGESLKFEFSVDEVYYNGKYTTGVRVKDGRYSKLQMLQFRMAGVVDNWGEYSWGYDVTLSTELIEWED